MSNRKQLAVVIGFYLFLFCPAVIIPLIIFGPSRAGDYHIEEINGINRQTVSFQTKDGSMLNGWLFMQNEPSKIVLISHGNAGNITHRAELAKLFLESGASVIMYDYRGYGYSSGKPSIGGILEDGLAAYDYLVDKEKIPPEEIVIFGESIGTGVASHTALHRKAAGLILQQPYVSLEDLAKVKIPLFHLYPSFAFPRPQLNSKEILCQNHPPVLIVHGKQDKTIPHTQSEKLMSLAKQPVTAVFLPNADHNDIYAVDADIYKSKAREFIHSLPSRVHRKGEKSPR